MKKSAKPQEDDEFESYDDEEDEEQDEESKGAVDHVMGDGQPKFILYDILGL
jgi:hypothetical protein